MFMKQDWFMRQIEVVAAAIAQLVFGKGEVEYEFVDEAHRKEAELLQGRLMELIREKRLGRAEDLLFEYLDGADRNGLVLAVDFYRKLNQLSDEDIGAGGFTRVEILEGLRDAVERYGLYLPGLMGTV